MVQLVQSFDPPGVGARDLKECLRLQAERRGLGALSRILIEEHLEALAAGEISRIARAVGVSTDEVLAAAIRSLNPRPGSIFAGGPVPYIVPDLIIERGGEDYVVLLNEAAGLRLRLSPSYREFLNRKDLSGKARSFLLSRLKRALTLVKAIEKRGATLYRIGVALVQLQRGFFDEGLIALRSLTLKDLAEAVGLHESTVSRAIANKYLQCPRGVFKLRFFVSSGVGAADGGKVSAPSVKELIKQLVSEEPRGQPLSDKEIAVRLSRQGINISRRTVAKYRSELGIPGSAARRNRAR
ncbi:RNA polymerase factor sigma-54 [Thermodesulfitimonas sp.]